MLIGGLGSAGLVAFSVGAFSFFSGLADPRARTPRVMAAAATMPDLKDGIPALAPEAGPAAPAQAASFNLPRPAPAEPQPAPSTPAETPLRSATLPAAAIVAGAAQDSPGQASKAAPPIQNVAVIAEAPRTAALVPPARAETVRAKAGQPSTFVALPAEAKPQRDPEPVHEARKLAPKAAAQKTAVRSKPAAVKSVAEAAPPPQQSAAAHPAEDEDAIPGSRQIRAGLKAIGGMFGSSDGD